MSHLPGIKRIRTRYRSPETDIRVVDVYPERHRYLQFGESLQGAFALDDPDYAVFEYVALMHVVSELRPWKSALVAGLGAGSTAQLLMRSHPYSELTVVEQNAQVVELAHRFFRLPRKMDVLCDEIRTYVQQTGNAYDLITMDCYGAQMMPPHLCTREFMLELKACLEPNGWVIWNVWSEACNDLAGHQLRTIQSAFEYSVAYHCLEDQNLVVCGSMSKIDPHTLQCRGTSYECVDLGDMNVIKEAEVLTDENLALVLLDFGVI